MSTRCVQCGTSIPYADHSVPPPSWCGPACIETWEAANPGTWIAVEDLTLAQRVELDAILGAHAGTA